MTEAEWEACPTGGFASIRHLLFEHRVAVAREGLPASFSVHLPADEANELDARSVRVDLSEVPPLPAARSGGPTARNLHSRVAPLDRPLEVVSDQQTLAARFATLGLGMSSTVPEVDFERDLVLLVTTSTGACEPVFTGVDLDRGSLIPRFVDGPDPLSCGTGRLAYTFVIAVERADLPPSFVVRRPADPALGVPAASLLVNPS